jgi:phosphopantothenoylcysteine decarboxylase/phosphopantothenate--cysteine ligase
MAQILIRKLDDRVKDSLRRRAQRNGHSLEQEVRNILSNATQEDPQPLRGAAIVAHLRSRGDIAMTTNEIMTLTRGE